MIAQCTAFYTAKNPTFDSKLRAFVCTALNAMYIYLSLQFGLGEGDGYRLVQLQSLGRSSFQSLVSKLGRLLDHGLADSLVHTLVIALCIRNLVDSLVSSDFQLGVQLSRQLYSQTGDDQLVRNWPTA